MTFLTRLSAGVAGIAIATTGVVDNTAVAQSLALEEIVVTARKREESLLEIPVAISAFSFDELDRSGFTNLEDLSFVTAGMHFNKQGGQIPGRFNTAVRFRGMDSNQSAASQQLGTVFLDGVYVSQGVASLDFSNLERVEIIKGPQSATFGRSTFAGAVNYVTKTPGFEYAGRAAAEWGEDGSYDISVSHEGPLVDDKLSYRISARGYGTDGQYRSNADGGELGRERTETLQAVLFAQPSENFSTKLRVLYSRDNDGPAAGLLLGSALSDRGSGSANAGTNCRSQGITSAADTLADYFCGPVPKVDVDAFIAPNTALTAFDIAAFRATEITDPRGTVSRPKVPGVPLVDFIGLRRKQWRASLISDYEFDDGHAINVVLGYSDMRASWVRDFDLTRAQNFLSQDPQRHEDYTAEITLDSPQDQALRYSVGANYFTVDYIQQGNGGLNIWGSDGGVTLGVIGGNLPGPHTLMTTAFPLETGETIGVFGSLGYDLTEDLTLDFEWRYQEDKIQQDERTTPGVEFEDKFKSFLPRVTLSYNPMDNSTIWATYSEGNLPGFFNTDLAPLNATDFAAVSAVVGGNLSLFNEEEKLVNYELGWKQQLFDNRMFFSLVAYHMDWSNLKTRQGIPITDTNGIDRVLNLQFNAGDADLDGIELEGGFALNENFSGDFTVNYAKGEYGTLTCGFSPFAPAATRSDCSGNTPARYPDWSGSFSTTWTDQMTNDWDYFIRFDGHYFGRAFNEEKNFSYIGKYWRFNLRAGFEMDGTRIEGYVKNIFDDDNYLAGARWSDFSGASLFDFLFSQGVATTPAEKRQFGVKVVHTF
ncbi:MAG: TonB-dependent receptor [Rhodospirillaceae bacterium]|nr:TonB-dependent receptor [Rhodospirillaceae bacterium]